MDTFAESISHHLNESSRRQDEMKTFRECVLLFRCFSETMGKMSTKTYAIFVIATTLGIVRYSKSCAKVCEFKKEIWYQSLYTR